MEYQFQDIERKWRKYWQENQTYQSAEDPKQPKFYALTMFPYPSGAGLHVGHPLGYIALDIFARYKKLKGFNVLNPMGYDSFGLPAEQYAIQTGKHPALTTAENIARYREQLDKIGFCFDWSREVRTSEPNYYTWTQWIFKQLFNSCFNPKTQKAEPIENFIAIASQNPGWHKHSPEEQEDIINAQRLAYKQKTLVNWCEALGTVLANDEVINGVSERGGHPVVQKEMEQWNLGMHHYAERLLQGLDKLDWSESIKEQQRNWIGKSMGAVVYFPKFEKSGDLYVFTTRPDTLYGVSFIAMSAQRFLDHFQTENQEILDFIEKINNISDRDKQASKDFTGIFTQEYALNPLTGEKLPIYIASYVLPQYGTGVVMGCPAGDERDFAFAKKYNISIKPIFDHQDLQNACTDKTAVLINSPLWDNLPVSEAISKALEILEEKNWGSTTVFYKLRSAGFSRQRYWGEPFPVYYKNGKPHLTPDDFAVELPTVDAYLPTKDGEPPLARAKNWVYTDENGNIYPMETNTMPGWAGSSWYFLRYLDPHNDKAFASKEKIDYWQNVDLYVGGAEHTTGHLLYARFWTKFLYDLGYIPFDEPFQKLINQGMILGRSSFVYRKKGTNTFVSKGLIHEHEVDTLHVDISLVDNDVLDIEKFKLWRAEYAKADFMLENGKYYCGAEIEKMSKSKHNVQTPDELVEKFGADTLRCYEMFLGPVQESKPWDTKGINGVHNFLRKFWRLFHQTGSFVVSEENPSAESLKTLHRTIKRVGEDIERFSLNTVVSTLMIAVNELQEQACKSRAILEPLTILLSPYAPHLAEEIWQKLGYSQSIYTATFPKFEEKYLVETSFNYPVSFNGKMRFQLTLPLDYSEEQIKTAVLAEEQTTKYLQGQKPKKWIVVKGKIINIVI